MDQNLTHRIRERAYEIWASNGFQDGLAEQHWFTAEREILDTPRMMLSAQPQMVKKSSGAAPRRVRKK
jgi:hypothetical protein